MVGEDKVAIGDVVVVVLVVVAMTKASVGIPFCANVSTCLPKQRDERCLDEDEQYGTSKTSDASKN